LLIVPVAPPKSSTVDAASQAVDELRRSPPASLTGVPIGLGGENALRIRARRAAARPRSGGDLRP